MRRKSGAHVHNLGIVFPGQGTQHVGMGSDLHQAFQEARNVYEEACDVLGFDIQSLCFEGPREELDRTVNTQVAVLTTDMAIYRIFERETGLQPMIMAGHSLGEYSALCAAGALPFVDALLLVAARGQYQQEAAPIGTGAMAAVIGLNAAQVGALCREVSSNNGAVFPAIINARDQIVISGDLGTIEKAVGRARELGAMRALKLPISVPCHCPLLDEAARRFAGDLEGVEIRDFEVDVIPNCDPEATYTRDSAKDFLIRQVHFPVYWQASIERMVRMGIDTIVEIGPKRTLTNLTKRIDAGIRVANVEDLASLKKTAAWLNSGS